jgi:hypothetical protein
MNKVTDVRGAISLQNSRVFFDTNIWILIYGFAADAAKYKRDLYSAGYKQLLDRKNVVVLNDYVVGEFFNRCTKFEYEIIKNEKESAGEVMPPLKSFRQSAEFTSKLEGIRDTCLHMLDDCEFVSVEGRHYDIESIVADCCAECADFSDLVLIEFCREEKLCVMTDDADYDGSGLDIITANRKITARR